MINDVEHSLDSIFRMAKNTEVSSTMEYYTAIKMNKVLIHTKTWMTIKKLSKKKSLTQRLYTVDFYLYVILQIEGK